MLKTEPFFAFLFPKEREKDVTELNEWVVGWGGYGKGNHSQRIYCLEKNNFQLKKSMLIKINIKSFSRRRHLYPNGGGNSSKTSKINFIKILVI